jgi:hypothetical protein
MMEEPGSFAGMSSSWKARARAARQQPNVVGNLVERHGQRLQRGAQLHEVVVRALHRELVRRRDEGQPGELRDLGGDLPIKARLRVEARADGRAAQRQPVHAASASSSRSRLSSSMPT